MYASHGPKLAKFGRANADNMAEVAVFVLLTIRQPFERVPAQMAEVRERKGEAASLFGSKRDGYLFLAAHKAELFSEFHRILRENTPDTRERLIELFMQVPGLGIAKAAFVLQCLGVETACLDTHNLQRLGLKETAFKCPGTLSAATVRAKIRTYIAACDAVMSSAGWWDSWCEYVAARKNLTAEAVSALHCSALGLS